jgi:murein DD-endopeptidase MepM/ murein hydrolase activator NlpD
MMDARKPDHNMRGRFCSLFVAVSLVVVAVLITSPVGSAEMPHSGRLSPQPLIEVVTFGVTPVSGVVDEGALRPKPGDVLYRATPPALGQQNEIETRALSAETWPGLFQRVADKLNSSVLESTGLANRMELLPALEPGKYVRLRSVGNGQTIEIDYVVRPEEAYSITLAADGIQVKPRANDPRVAEKMRGDPAKASLFTATDAIGLPENLVLALAEIFADDVDFFRELHYGYRCTIVYEALYREGHIDRAGRILAAEFTIRDRRLQVFYFSDGRARDGYYTETGKSMKKAFRRSPVEFSRVTSEYTLARFHPILGLWRAHRGIDYAAPSGSRVMATADGIVEFMGDRGELGNLVVLRHYGRFLTYYGHLSAFASGLTVGSKVEKSQLIGFVGMTGLTTGPHVHYEFRIDNGAGEGAGIPIPPPDVLEEPPVRSEDFFRTMRMYRDKFQAAQKAHFVVLE